MKNPLLAALAAVCLMSLAVDAGSRDAQWRAVEEAAGKGLPKTAIDALEPIIAGAVADRAYPEAIRAITRRVALETAIEGGRAEEAIVRLQAWLDRVPGPMQPTLQAILAHWYWRYFQQNRWRLHQRTQTTAEPGPDIQTWDLARILAEIDARFTAALAQEAMLQATPIREYDALLRPGSAPDACRPTLWDFLAHEALQFYQAGEVGPIETEGAFEIDAVTTPAFSPAAEFAAWEPGARNDADSPKLRALRLFQKLLRFHAADADRSAWFDTDLARLEFMRNAAIGDDNGRLYRAALERLIDASGGHEIQARALAILARHHYEAGQLVEARALALRGMETHPGSAGGALCESLVRTIEAPSVEVTTERVWTAPWPTIEVDYRNLTRVHFRAVPVAFERYLKKSRWNYGGFDTEIARDVYTGTPAATWSALLPATPDYRQRRESVAVPRTLKPGFYAVVASHSEAFGDASDHISLAFVWVSELALVIESRNDGRPLGGFVLEADSGAPVAGATVRAWRRDRDGRFRAASETRTDADGRFSLSLSEEHVVLVAEYGGQAVASADEVWSGPGRQRSREGLIQTVFFTDRALYRPGQSIHYKGVTLHSDPGAGAYSVVARRAITVLFLDSNGREIARASHQTNDHGSFSGVFTAPRDRATGQMSIRVDGGVGIAAISVEEYKRPKFRVEIAAPIEAARLDRPVEVVGKATAYSGSAVGGATVRWRVERRVRLPRWCWWWEPPTAKAIAHGTAVTSASGTFVVHFPAEPDRAVPEKLEPVFDYVVHVDVTDTTGETRSDERIVRAGYTALEAVVSAAEWQTAEAPVEFSILTTSIDGEPQAASGRISVHALRQPDRVERGPLEPEANWWRSADARPAVDPSNPDSWEPAALVASIDFSTDRSGNAKVAAALKPGIYRASLETQDRFGRTVTARQTVEVFDPEASRYDVRVPQRVAAPSWVVHPGQTFRALWGTGYKSGRAYVEFECDGRVLRRGWTAEGRTQESLEQKITEKMRGGLTMRIVYVRENRAHVWQRIIDVPWRDKELTVTWETFRSRLTPGGRETWTAVVKGADAQRACAEMVAALYDASLDQFAPHGWPAGFGVFRREHFRGGSSFQNRSTAFAVLRGGWEIEQREVEWSYRSFMDEIADPWGGRGAAFRGWAGAKPAALPMAAPLEMAGEEVVVLSPFSVSSEREEGYTARETLAGARIQSPLADAASAIRVQPKPSFSSGGTVRPDLTRITARSNLNETAFFFPHLTCGEDGTVRMSFTMPEALTEWRFLGFAHDAQLRAGYLEGRAVTAKDLMVEPNPPRFVREGDTIEFTVKVSNQSDAAQTGVVRLTFADAATLAAVDAALGNTTAEQTFDVPAKQARTCSWRVTIPDGMGFLAYRAVGASAGSSDGEEGHLPVLSRRILVTESLPLSVRGSGTRRFEFERLLDSAGSETLRHQSLTVQMVSQPAWYAVMALPYLMEYPYECSEQIFNRYYGNMLARHVAASDPKIRRIFDLWRNTPALDSPLSRNQDLKSVMLEETPWLRQAADESQARRQVGLLFEANRLDEEAGRALQQLGERQLEDGLWPWFPGGRPSEFISLYIVTGFGRLRHLGAPVDVAPAVRALRGLDRWIERRYRAIRPEHRDDHLPGHLECIYLYGRSFFLRDQPIGDEHREAVEFLQRQVRRHWLRTDCRLCQAQAALALQRMGDVDTPRVILHSLRERSVVSDELGMFWRDTEPGWWWYRAPIETQATMIEAFAEVASDGAAVEAMQVWLLQQKRTRDWKTTKATADAVYALLLRGGSLLTGDAVVEVALGGEVMRPEKVEAGTGFHEQRWGRGQIRPEMGDIIVTKSDDGLSWGSVHWQYLEDVAKVTPHAGTPLKIKKTLWVRETTDKGPVLRPVGGAVAVGDELVVRLELRTDRDMEYVHLKDQRGSGTEPVSVLSRHRHQDGLAYYESTRDTASHYFIEYLPKGTYVFEYSTRVQLRGHYQSGIAEIQCMYAPEFNSHSESFTLEVK